MWISHVNRSNEFIYAALTFDMNDGNGFITFCRNTNNIDTVESNIMSKTSLTQCSNRMLNKRCSVQIAYGESDVRWGSWSIRLTDHLMRMQHTIKYTNYFKCTHEEKTNWTISETESIDVELLEKRVVWWISRTSPHSDFKFEATTSENVWIFQMNFEYIEKLYSGSENGMASPLLLYDTYVPIHIIFSWFFCFVCLSRLRVLQMPSHLHGIRMLVHHLVPIQVCGSVSTMPWRIATLTQYVE